jgi:hypothetical protein
MKRLSDVFRAGRGGKIAQPGGYRVVEQIFNGTQGEIG